MKEEKIEVRYARRKRKYTSYIGEITPAFPDLVQRNFHADKPNKLWLTDITEFAAADSKIYLSPLIDCFDDKVVAYSTSKNPDNNLVEEMIDKALSSLGKQPKDLTIHTDRGGHYRGSMWIEKLEGQGIKRSMSRRGKSGDNAACEGFSGRMKTEMFYHKKWNTAEELNQEIGRYINFYNNERIKTTLGGITIKEYRDKLTKSLKNSPKPPEKQNLSKFPQAGKLFKTERSSAWQKTVSKMLSRISKRGLFRLCLKRLRVCQTFRVYTFLEQLNKA